MADNTTKSVEPGVMDDVLNAAAEISSGFSNVVAAGDKLAGTYGAISGATKGAASAIGSLESAFSSAADKITASIQSGAKESVEPSFKMGQQAVTQQTTPSFSALSNSIDDLAGKIGGLDTPSATPSVKPEALKMPEVKVNVELPTTTTKAPVTPSESFRTPIEMGQQMPVKNIPIEPRFNTPFRFAEGGSVNNYNTSYVNQTNSVGTPPSISPSILRSMPQLNQAGGSIRETSENRLMGAGVKDTIIARVERDEFVIKAKTAKELGSSLLFGINSGEIDRNSIQLARNIKQGYSPSSYQYTPMYNRPMIRRAEGGYISLSDVPTFNFGGFGGGYGQGYGIGQMAQMINPFSPMQLGWMGMFAMSGPMFSVGQILSTSTQMGMEQAQQFGTGALGGIGGSFTGLPRLTKLFQQVANTDAFELYEAMHNSFVVLKNVWKSPEKATETIQSSIEMARRMPIEVTDLLKVFSTFSVNPELRTVLTGKKEMGQLATGVAGLSFLVPEQGTQGAIFAIREALAGQFRSMKMRFDINPEIIASSAGMSMEQLKAKPANFLQALDTFLKQNLGQSTFSELQMTVSKQIGNIYDALTGGIFKSFRSTGGYESVTRYVAEMSNQANAAFSSAPVENFFKQFGAKVGTRFAQATQILKGIDFDTDAPEEITTKIGKSVDTITTKLFKDFAPDAGKLGDIMAPIGEKAGAAVSNIMGDTMNKIFSSALGIALKQLVTLPLSVVQGAGSKISPSVGAGIGELKSTVGDVVVQHPQLTLLAGVAGTKALGGAFGHIKSTLADAAGTGYGTPMLQSMGSLFTRFGASSTGRFGAISSGLGGMLTTSPMGTVLAAGAGIYGLSTAISAASELMSQDKNQNDSINKTIQSLKLAASKRQTRDISLSELAEKAFTTSVAQSTYTQGNTLEQIVGTTTLAGLFGAMGGGFAAKRGSTYQSYEAGEKYMHERAEQMKRIQPNIQRRLDRYGLSMPQTLMEDIATHGVRGALGTGTYAPAYTLALAGSGIPQFNPPPAGVLVPSPANLMKRLAVNPMTWQLALGGTMALAGGLSAYYGAEEYEMTKESQKKKEAITGTLDAVAAATTIPALAFGGKKGLAVAAGVQALSLGGKWAADKYFSTKDEPEIKRLRDEAKKVLVQTNENMYKTIETVAMNRISSVSNFGELSDIENLATESWGSKLQGQIDQLVASKKITGEQGKDMIKQMTGIAKRAFTNPELFKQSRENIIGFLRAQSTIPESVLKEVGPEVMQSIMGFALGQEANIATPNVQELQRIQKSRTLMGVVKQDPFIKGLLESEETRKRARGLEVTPLGEEVGAQELFSRTWNSFNVLQENAKEMLKARFYQAGQQPGATPITWKEAEERSIATMEKLGVSEAEKYRKTLTALATKPEEFTKIIYGTDQLKEQFTNIGDVLQSPGQMMKMYRQSMDEILGKEMLLRGGIGGAPGQEIQKTPDMQIQAQMAKTMPGWVAPGVIGKTMNLQFEEYSNAYAKEMEKLQAMVEGTPINDAIQGIQNVGADLKEAFKNTNVEKLAGESKRQKEFLINALEKDYKNILSQTEDNKLTKEKFETPKKPSKDAQTSGLELAKSLLSSEKMEDVMRSSGWTFSSSAQGRAFLEAQKEYRKTEQRLGAYTSYSQGGIGAVLEGRAEGRQGIFETGQMAGTAVEAIKVVPTMQQMLGTLTQTTESLIGGLGHSLAQSSQLMGGAYAQGVAAPYKRVAGEWMPAEINIGGFIAPNQAIQWKQQEEKRRTMLPEQMLRELNLTSKQGSAEALGIYSSLLENAEKQGFNRPEALKALEQSREALGLFGVSPSGQLRGREEVLRTQNQAEYIKAIKEEVVPMQQSGRVKEAYDKMSELGLKYGIKREGDEKPALEGLSSAADTVTRALNDFGSALRNVTDIVKGGVQGGVSGQPETEVAPPTGVTPTGGAPQGIPTAQPPNINFAGEAQAAVSPSTEKSEKNTQAQQLRNMIIGEPSKEDNITKGTEAILSQPTKEKPSIASVEDQVKRALGTANFAGEVYAAQPAEAAIEPPDINSLFRNSAILELQNRKYNELSSFKRPFTSPEKMEISEEEIQTELNRQLQLAKGASVEDIQRSLKETAPPPIPTPTLTPVSEDNITKGTKAILGQPTEKEPSIASVEDQVKRALGTANFAGSFVSDFGTMGEYVQIPEILTPEEEYGTISPREPSFFEKIKDADIAGRSNIKKKGLSVDSQLRGVSLYGAGAAGLSATGLMAAPAIPELAAITAGGLMTELGVNYTNGFLRSVTGDDKLDVDRYGIISGVGAGIGGTLSTLGKGAIKASALAADAMIGGIYSPTYNKVDPTLAKILTNIGDNIPAFAEQVNFAGDVYAAQSAEASVSSDINALFRSSAIKDLRNKKHSELSAFKKLYTSPEQIELSEEEIQSEMDKQLQLAREISVEQIQQDLKDQEIPQIPKSEDNITKGIGAILSQPTKERPSIASVEDQVKKAMGTANFAGVDGFGQLPPGIRPKSGQGTYWREDRYRVLDKNELNEQNRSLGFIKPEPTIMQQMFGSNIEDFNVLPDIMSPKTDEMPPGSVFPALKESFEKYQDIIGKDNVGGVYFSDVMLQQVTDKGIEMGMIPKGFKSHGVTVDRNIILPKSEDKTPKGMAIPTAIGAAQHEVSHLVEKGLKTKEGIGASLISGIPYSETENKPINMASVLDRFENDQQFLGTKVSDYAEMQRKINPQKFKEEQFAEGMVKIGAGEGLDQENLWRQSQLIDFAKAAKSRGLLVSPGQRDTFEQRPIGEQLSALNMYEYYAKAIGDPQMLAETIAKRSNIKAQMNMLGITQEEVDAGKVTDTLLPEPPKFKVTEPTNKMDLLTGKNWNYSTFTNMDALIPKIDIPSETKANIPSENVQALEGLIPETKETINTTVIPSKTNMFGETIGQQLSAQKPQKQELKVGEKAEYIPQKGWIVDRLKGQVIPVVKDREGNLSYTEKEVSDAEASYAHDSALQRDLLALKVTAGGSRFPTQSYVSDPRDEYTELYPDAEGNYVPRHIATVSPRLDKGKGITPERRAAAEIEQKRREFSSTFRSEIPKEISDKFNQIARKEPSLSAAEIYQKAIPQKSLPSKEEISNAERNLSGYVSDIGKQEYDNGMVSVPMTDEYGSVVALKEFRNTNPAQVYNQLKAKGAEYAATGKTMFRTEDTIRDKNKLYYKYKDPYTGAVTTYGMGTKVSDNWKNFIDLEGKTGEGILNNFPIEPSTPYTIPEEPEKKRSLLSYAGAAAGMGIGAGMIAYGLGLFGGTTPQPTAPAPVSGTITSGTGIPVRQTPIPETQMPIVKPIAESSLFTKEMAIAEMREDPIRAIRFLAEQQTPAEKLARRVLLSNNVGFKRVARGGNDYANALKYLELANRGIQTPNAELFKFLDPYTTQYHQLRSEARNRKGELLREPVMSQDEFIKQEQQRTSIVKKEVPQTERQAVKFIEENPAEAGKLLTEKYSNIKPQYARIVGESGMYDINADLANDMRFIQKELSTGNIESVKNRILSTDEYIESVMDIRNSRMGRTAPFATLEEASLASRMGLNVVESTNAPAPTSPPIEPKSRLRIKLSGTPEATELAMKTPMSELQNQARFQKAITEFGYESAKQLDIPISEKVPSGLRVSISGGTDAEIAERMSKIGETTFGEVFKKVEFRKGFSEFGEELADAFGGGKAPTENLPNAGAGAGAVEMPAWLKKLGESKVGRAGKFVSKQALPAAIALDVGLNASEAIASPETIMGEGRTSVADQIKGTVAGSIASLAGPLAGMYAGAKLGALGGGAIGALFGGIGAPIGAAIGGFAGGIGGALLGEEYLKMAPQTVGRQLGGTAETPKEEKEQGTAFAGEMPPEQIVPKVQETPGFFDKIGDSVSKALSGAGEFIAEQYNNPMYNRSYEEAKKERQESFLGFAAKSALGVGLSPFRTLEAVGGAIATPAGAALESLAQNEIAQQIGESISPIEPGTQNLGEATKGLGDTVKSLMESVGTAISPIEPDVFKPSEGVKQGFQSYFQTVGETFAPAEMNTDIYKGIDTELTGDTAFTRAVFDVGIGGGINALEKSITGVGPGMDLGQTQDYIMGNPIVQENGLNEPPMSMFAKAGEALNAAWGATPPTEPSVPESIDAATAGGGEGGETGDKLSNVGAGAQSAGDGLQKLAEAINSALSAISNAGKGAMNAATESMSGAYK